MALTRDEFSVLSLAVAAASGLALGKHCKETSSAGCDTRKGAFSPPWATCYTLLLGKEPLPSPSGLIKNSEHSAAMIMGAKCCLAAPHCELLQEQVGLSLAISLDCSQSSINVQSLVFSVACVSGH